MLYKKGAKTLSKVKQLKQTYEAEGTTEHNTNSCLTYDKDMPSKTTTDIFIHGVNCAGLVCCSTSGPGLTSPGFFSAASLRGHGIRRLPPPVSLSCRQRWNPPVTRAPNIAPNRNVAPLFIWNWIWMIGFDHFH
ncbi:hypothetical protein V6N13_071008 [Hibiscus sabdariffa]|uniref:Uncharacterized protein n=1 Tax=Hibiscus sabdariffa TaxID=183260 RepID=A0ABR2TF20_9ROSI